MRGLSHAFGPVCALTAVDLDVHPGEVVGLLGPNGAGKTTLLRALAGLVRPRSGRAWIGGLDVTAREARGRLGLVLGDDHAWYWRLSGRRNLEFFAVLSGLPRRAAARRVGQLLEESGLGDVIERPMGDYSTGMRSRLALARALLAEPAVLALDEPGRGLDAAAEAELRLLLRRCAGDGVAVLIASHDVEQISDAADRVVVLDQGRVTATTSDTVDRTEIDRLLRQTR